MRHHKESTLIRWAKEGRIETFFDICAGRSIEITFTATGKIVMVKVEAG